MITRKVPCPNRIKDVESAAKNLKEVEVGDGWVEAEDALKAVPNDEDNYDMDAEAHVVEDKVVDEGEEEVFDMDDLENE